MHAGEWLEVTMMRQVQALPELTSDFPVSFSRQRILASYEVLA